MPQPNRRNMPTVNAIRKYWVDNLDLEKKGFDSVFEFLEDSDVCFACGMNYGEKLDRAHIFPLCEGGSNDVENLHCLCYYCHKASEYLHGDGYWEWFYERTYEDVMYHHAASTGINIFSALKYKNLKEQYLRISKSKEMNSDNLEFDNE